jgi:hypothetical protein
MRATGVGVEEIGREPCSKKKRIGSVEPAVIEVVNASRLVKRFAMGHPQSSGKPEEREGSAHRHFESAPAQACHTVELYAGSAGLSAKLQKKGFASLR